MTVKKNNKICGTAKSMQQKNNSKINETFPLNKFRNLWGHVLGNSRDFSENLPRIPLYKIVCRKCIALEKSTWVTELKI